MQAIRGLALLGKRQVELRSQRWSHQFPWARPLCQEPPICFSAVRLSMSSKVLPLKSAIAAFHVPETVLPFIIRADQVPRQPLADFRADQVPSRTTWLLSPKSAQEPLAAFLAAGRTWADQRPRRNLFCPAVAIQLPFSAEGVCWATAHEASSRVTASVHFFIGNTAPAGSPWFKIQSYLQRRSGPWGPWRYSMLTMCRPHAAKKPATDR